ncbi:hypothetical protein AXG93_4601s1130 [Marchantia polymorpha subsp. ruderalis]|uniref:DUF659 domain-containing protein n=1 Tax=Marchantia polymorpha subsp. ruderalis TaxID=1480154 RepID=A0A176VYY4_MARPO|nr:hypothetical protein AXG93_4601s1130 [Marchantia polymorpha subsp. ruderalis]
MMSSVFKAKKVEVDCKFLESQWIIANERNNPILGLIPGTGRPATLFNNASNDNVHCAASGLATRPMQRDGRRNCACTALQITTPPHPHRPASIWYKHMTLRCVFKTMIPALVLEGFENVVVDYIVQGGVTLRAVGNERFKQFVVTLTHVYEPPLTRTILRRIVELHRVLEPALKSFLCNLTVAMSSTLDGWSNQNLKGFYVVTAHWMDVVTLKAKSILLAILDVKCGAGVGMHVGTDLFEYLKRMDRDVVIRVLDVTNDNGSDATNAIVRLFRLVNVFVGY